MYPSLTSSIYLHPALCKNLNVIRTKIFAFNWAISPNLGRKIQNCSLWLKTGLHGILEVLIPNPDLNFWNSDPEINFWVNLGRKTKKFPFCLKIDTLGIWRILIFIPKLDVWISIFGQIWVEKFKVVCFAQTFAQRVSRGCWFLFRH